MNNLTSPLLDFNSNITPSLNALTNGLFDLKDSNTPHLPPLNIDANSHEFDMPPMPIVDVIGNNIPPPTDGLDWHTICTLNSLMGQQQQTSDTNANHRKRKKIEFEDRQQLLLND